MIERIATGIDWAMAAMFFSATWAKASGFANFRQEIASYRLVPGRWLTGAGAVVLLAEGGLFAAFSAAGYAEGWKEAAAAALLLLFIGLTRSVARRRTGGCACFGAGHPLGIAPTARNLIAVGLLGISAWIDRPAAAAGDVAIAAASAAAVGIALEIVKLRRQIGRRANE